jgi:hypothetical protein
MSKSRPPTETTISGGTTVPAGTLVVVDGKVVVNPTTQTAAALLASLSGAAVTTIDVAKRVGTFPDTGLPIFDVF